MHREKRRNKIIILILVGIICIMGVGYAAFQTRLNITGTSNISSDWNIKIISADVTDTGGDGENVKNNYTDLTADLEANLYNKGDYVEYSIIVENKGTFDAKLETLGITNSNNEAIKITSTGLTKGQTLYKGTTVTLKVKIEYNNDYEGDASGTSGESTVDLDFVQNSGGTIEPTVDHLVTYDYTTNGGESTTAENAYIAEGESINLSYKAIKFNYEFIGWNTNKDATEGLTSLTMGTSDITLYAIFKQIDTTPPTIENISTSSTTSSITVVTTATEDISEITKYEYSIDNGSYIEGENTYTFTGLTQNTSHTIKVRVTNSEGLSSESEIQEVKTNVLNVPTFSQTDISSGVRVTITYPSGSGLTYQYKKDNGSWMVATQTQPVEFTESGTLVAKVIDGTNEESASYIVNVGISIKKFIEIIPKVTSGDGLYVDSYESSVYTYRGANPNNYVIFNGENWRIISANSEDNTIKIIRNEILEDMLYDNSRTKGGYCNYVYCNVWGSNSTMYDDKLNLITSLGRTYYGTKYDLPDKEAELNTYLNNNYYNGLNIEEKSMIKEDAIYKAGVYDYNLLDIMIKQISAAKWKGKVALIDVSEYIRASTDSSCESNNSNCRNNNWMYINETWWTMLPYSNKSSSGYVTVIYNGMIGYYDAWIKQGVRPVVTLSPEVQITGGDGSSSNPYTLTI